MRRKPKTQHISQSRRDQLKEDMLAIAASPDSVEAQDLLKMVYENGDYLAVTGNWEEFQELIGELSAVEQRIAASTLPTEPNDLGPEFEAGPTLANPETEQAAEHTQDEPMPASSETDDLDITFSAPANEVAGLNDEAAKAPKHPLEGKPALPQPTSKKGSPRKKPPIKSDPAPGQAQESGSVPTDSSDARTTGELPSGSKPSLEIPAPTDPAQPSATKTESNGGEQTVPDYEDHEIACAYPLDPDDEIEILADDIRLNGLLEPGTLYEDKVLDGRRRKRACKRAGKPMRYNPLPPNVDPVSFVISKHALRREIHDKGQLAAIAVEFERLFIEEAKKRQLAGKGSDGSGGRGHARGVNLEEKVPQGFEAGDAERPDAAEKERAKQTRDRAAALMGVSGRYVALAKVVRNLNPALYEKVRLGKVKLLAAVREVKPKHKAHTPKSQSEQVRQNDAGSKAAGNGAESGQVKTPTVAECLEEIDTLVNELGDLCLTTMDLYPEKYKSLRTKLRSFVEDIETAIDRAAERYRVAKKKRGVGSPSDVPVVGTTTKCAPIASQEIAARE